MTAGTGQAKIQGMRILVVDDNATNRLILSEQLASWNTRHDEAESAAQALEMLRVARAQGDPFRIVISDMQMPEMDGESLGKSIKADPEISDTILVMMTSLGRRGDAKRFKAIGFSAYLTKPVKQSQLYDCLATVIGAGVSAAAAQESDLVTRHTISEARRLKVRHPAGRGQPHQPAGGAGHPGKNGFSRRRHRQWTRGHPGPGSERIRSGVHGCADAGHGRLRGHRRHPFGTNRDRRIPGFPSLP